MRRRLVALVIVWLLALLTLWVIEPYLADFWLSADAPRAVTPAGDLSAGERSTIEIFRRVSPSVVHVFARGGGSEPFSEESAVIQSGSGIVWDDAGHIVTNHHVIAGTAEIGVRLVSGEFVNATVVGIAAAYDLAVLQIDRPRSPLHPIAIGSSAHLQVGQFTYAIGNPYGLDQTLTSGIVSALHRHLPESDRTEIADVIQTDAAINPGNSGGPLLDSAGRLIGLNTAILSRSGASSGIGFAIPVDTVNRVVPQLIRTGRVPTPGIGIVSGSPAIAAKLGVDGIIVMRVLPDTPAAKAGLRGVDPETGAIGDIITAANGHPVRTIADLSAILNEVGIGKPVTLTLMRDGATREVKLDVADIPPTGER